MKILAITQARYGSTRLPAKILKKVNGMTLLEIHLRRILQSKLISKLKVATTNEEGAGYIAPFICLRRVILFQHFFDMRLRRLLRILHAAQFRRLIPHQRDKLAHLESQRILHISVRALRRNKIITQDRILLPHAVRAILRLAVHGGRPIQFAKYDTACPLQVQSRSCAQRYHAEVCFSLHKPRHGVILLFRRLPPSEKRRMIALHGLLQTGGYRRW